jgi:poly-gamma-glutamate synthesis protein (capsule biosynthesis protein)
MNRLGALASVLFLVAGGCGTGQTADDERVATLLFAGDLMLGREVEPVARLDPVGMFEDVRFVVREVDIAAANLESPLTTSPHLDPAVHALEADPDLAALIGDAGFDVLGVANNHAGDAGPESVLDTVNALVGAGLVAIGGGSDEEAALRPVIIDRNGLRIAYLAFDATGQGVTAGTSAGIATWNAAQAEIAVREARRLADIVTVAIHGGIEYLFSTDTYLKTIAEQLAGWGVDVVWGHGPHVVQPVWSIDNGGHTTVVATSLGNFLFDQTMPGTRSGAVLEVVVTGDGVGAYRVGSVEHEDLRVHFTGWHDPTGDAVLHEQAWWSLVSAKAQPDIGPAEVPEGLAGDVTASGLGDVTGDGNRELVVSFRRPFRETLVNQSYPEVHWTDAEGRSAHLGVYQLDPFESRWVAGSLSRPVSSLAVCDGAVSLGFGMLDGEQIQATGAWVWGGFGFWYSGELAGAGTPVCVDVDGDGMAEPAVVGRNP